jgi:hypothetical protein
MAISQTVSYWFREALRELMGRYANQIRTRAAKICARTARQGDRAHTGPENPPFRRQIVPLIQPKRPHSWWVVSLFKGWRPIPARPLRSVQARVCLLRNRALLRIILGCFYYACPVVPVNAWHGFICTSDLSRPGSKTPFINPTQLIIAYLLLMLSLFNSLPKVVCQCCRRIG